ncbi:MAG: hypothetical protein NTW96_05685 [Planctomycetia bacterium]|nr:hypothetical protein [Planctomycetia bacterium]
MSDPDNKSRREFLRESAGGLVAAAVGAPALTAATEPAARPEPGPRIVRVPASYYQQFDADPNRDVPAEGYGGWKKAAMELDLRHTAVVVMHAWDSGTPAEFPGWYRCVEYIPRANAICREVFPKLLSGVRAAGVPLFHFVGGGRYYENLPGYQRAKKLAAEPPKARETIAADPTLERLRQFRSDNVFVGKHNQADVAAGFARLDFAPEARPLGEEGVAEDGEQLFGLCKAAGVNHLVYAGFAINWCLLLSPGGMHEMSGAGILCSAFRDATTAVENKDSARRQWAKELGLWRVALAFGFVFDVDEFLAAARGAGPPGVAGS